MKKTILLFSLTTLFVITACNISSGLGFKTVRGSGDVITEMRDVSGFDSVDVCCGMELILTQGDRDSLKIEADDNFMDEILTTVKNGTLNIQYRVTSTVNYRPSQAVQLYLSVVDVNQVSISGGGKFTNESITTDRFELDLSGGSSAIIGVFIADDVSLRVSGGGDIDADSIQTEAISINMSGGSDVDIEELAADSLYLENSGGGRAGLVGSVTEADINLSGASSLNGQDLASKEVAFSSSGGGRSTLWVEDSLEATLSGGSSLEYYGTPDILREELSGGSDLDSLGER